MVGYFHNICANIAPMGIYCLRDCCSSEESQLGGTNDYSSPSVGYVAHSNTMLTLKPRRVKQFPTYRDLTQKMRKAKKTENMII